MSAFRVIRELRRFESIPASSRQIVFYAEDAGHWPHYEPILQSLEPKLKEPVLYVTSSAKDPILSNAPNHIKPFFIAGGLATTYFFRSLEAKTLVTTMPDLETFHLKRSRVSPVHYVYVFHSMVSTHMTYRPGAFDHYDSILCVGPHHIDEIRAREKMLSLSPKHLVEHGYGKLDKLLEKTMPPPHPKTVLIAPSWGENGLLETLGESVVENLLRNAWHVIVRPHPETIRRFPHVVQGLQRRFQTHPLFQLETQVRDSSSLAKAAVMISDWSGAAFEFHLAYDKPVLFLDLPRKINNPDYEKISLTAVEVSFREKLGEILSPSKLSELDVRLNALVEKKHVAQNHCTSVRRELVFNLGKSGEVAAEFLLSSLSDEKRGRPIHKRVSTSTPRP